ncbi:MAG: hypothetical protein LQ348_006638 [Seirophora lacunosa]|nr:MAG: hypothetical protein LQ344_001947 [Seirophora lacunosa]KAI4173137.1 MAG: hypothetical protein LQ348_006638 [Seirophora lacunosa]
MKRKRGLEDLPQELVDKIIEDLDLFAVKSLRLACKKVCDRTYARFRCFFESQRTDLTSKSLKRLSLIANHPKLATAVRCVVVLALVYDLSELDRTLRIKRRRVYQRQGLFSLTLEPQASPEELQEAQQTRERLYAQMQERDSMIRNETDLQLLADTFRSFGKLNTLAVEPAVSRGRANHELASSVHEWYTIWIRAAQVYRTVMLSVARSGVAISNLHIYTSRASQRCSVPTWDINKHIPALLSAKFGRSAEHIKTISLSISTKVETDCQKIAEARAKLCETNRAYYQAGLAPSAGLRFDNNPAAVVAEGNFPGVARLLKQMPNLQRLDLHLYRTLWKGADSYAKVFSCLVEEEVVLPSLRQCKLRGLYCDETSLLAFLRAHPNIATLELRSVKLVSGAWRPIFARLCAMPLLQRVTLQNIRAPPEGGVVLRERMVNLGPKHPTAALHEDDGIPSWSADNRRSYPCGGGLMVHTRTFSREEMQRERFEFAEVPDDALVMASPAHHRFFTSNQAEYGPP